MQPSSTSFSSLLSHLQSNFPELTFKPGKKFSFRPPKTIFFNNTATKSHFTTAESDHLTLLLLHELAHALCRHRTFRTHLERVKLESEAWSKTKELCQTYQIPFDADFAEAELDTYRNWLHSKSRCKTCGLTCFQTPDGKYHCPSCEL